MAADAVSSLRAGALPVSSLGLLCSGTVIAPSPARKLSHPDSAKITNEIASGS